MKSLRVLKIAIIASFIANTNGSIVNAITQNSSKSTTVDLKKILSCFERKAKNKIEIYTTRTCPYCIRAKELLHKNCIEFEEIDVSDNSEMRTLMTKRAQGKTSVPQIFINDILIGGSTDLIDLEESGKLALMYGLKCCKS